MSAQHSSWPRSLGVRVRLTINDIFKLCQRQLRPVTIVCSFVKSQNLKGGDRNFTRDPWPSSGLRWSGVQSKAWVVTRSSSQNITDTQSCQSSSWLNNEEYAAIASQLMQTNFRHSLNSRRGRINANATQRQPRHRAPNNSPPCLRFFIPRSFQRT